MSIQSLEILLSRILTQLRPEQPGYSSLFERDGIAPTAYFPNEIVDPIRQEIAATPELAEFSDRMIHDPLGSRRLTSWNVANAIIYRLLAGSQPIQIVSELVDLAQRTTCDTWIYTGVYGGGISQRIELAKDVVVMPAANAPLSLARELIFGIDRRGQTILEKGFPRLKPNIAVLVTEEVAIYREPDRSTFPSFLEKIDRAIRALTLAGTHAFVRSWQTSWIDHPAIPYEGFGGWGGTGSFDAPPHPSGRADPIAPVLASEMYSKLGSMNPQARGPIELAIDRLRRSRTHPPFADAALDIGIASEIILLHGIKGSELRHRFSVRGAYLLGLDVDDRQTKFLSFRSLYDARSQAAHEGTLDAKMCARLPEFDLLCTAIIREIVNRQQFPDWERMTFGG